MSAGINLFTAPATPMIHLKRLLLAFVIMRRVSWLLNSTLASPDDSPGPAVDFRKITPKFPNVSTVYGKGNFKFNDLRVSIKIVQIG